MSDYTSHIEVRQGSERGFGVVFAFVFGLFGIWPMFSAAPPRFILLLVAAIFLLLAFLAPKLLKIPNKLWLKLGKLLGVVVAPIVMGLVYFVAVLPTGLWIRLTGKDLLSVKIDKSAKSYWVERTEKMQSMRNQF